MISRARFRARIEYRVFGIGRSSRITRAIICETRGNAIDGRYALALHVL
jgi:hypothetical protein